MPIFEYTCMACGHRFEKLQKADCGETAECPSCASAEVRRELSSFSSGGTAAACFSGG